MYNRSLIPFGESCIIAKTLKTENKRVVSLPFDWIVSNAAMNTKITKKVISNCFNIEEYCEFNKLTLRNSLGYTFNHHILYYLKQNNLTIGTMRRNEIVYKDTYNYLLEIFQRRFERLKCLTTQKHTLVCACNDNVEGTNFLFELLELNPNNNIIFIHKNITVKHPNIQTYNIDMYKKTQISKQIKQLI